RRVDRVLEPRVVLEMPDVVHAARRQVVEDMHRVSAFDQLVAEVRADEACTPGDQVPQTSIPIPCPCALPSRPCDQVDPSFRASANASGSKADFVCDM